MPISSPWGNEAMCHVSNDSQWQLKDKEVALEVFEVSLEEFESRERDRRIYDVAEFCMPASLLYSSNIDVRRLGVP
jgi:hypothetical protein